MRAIGLALALGLILVACGPPSTDNDAATAAARIKGGLEGQAAAVQSLGTQAAKVATQVPGAIATAGAIATQAPSAAATVAAVTTQASGAVATVQANATAQAIAGAAGAAAKGAAMTPDQMGQAARAVAARALNVTPDQVTVERVDSVDWRDTSLGCSEPGKAYAQVITEGFRIVVNAGGQRREVHADASGRRMMYCPSPTQ